MSAIVRPNLAEVFEHYSIRVIGRGAGWVKCECPSMEHEDANPSASMNEELGKWNCFSCGKTGDGLDIIMEREGLARIADAQQYAARNLASSGRAVRTERGPGGELLGAKRDHRGGGTFRPPWRGL